MHGMAIWDEKTNKILTQAGPNTCLRSSIFPGCEEEKNGFRFQEQYLRPRSLSAWLVPTPASAWMAGNPRFRTTTMTHEFQVSWRMRVMNNGSRKRPAKHGSPQPDSRTHTVSHPGDCESGQLPRSTQFSTHDSYWRRSPFYAWILRRRRTSSSPGMDYAREIRIIFLIGLASLGRCMPVNTTLILPPPTSSPAQRQHSSHTTRVADAKVTIKPVSCRRQKGVGWPRVPCALC